MRCLTFAASFLSLVCLALAAQLPDKVYGVNLGSWLLIEPWMLPAEWTAMGGEICDKCADCIETEFAFVQAYPDTADMSFEKHWSTWFTRKDVFELKELGINTIRIPLGYWLVEPIVKRSTEFYPRGGMRHLKEGLKWLKEAGMVAILDHHALPGVHSPNQMFAGRCTSDVEFYTPENYHRALIWSAVMTAFSHLDPDFESVFSIEAVNEPIMDATKTPGYGNFQKNFVKVVRGVESALGITTEPSSDGSYKYQPTNSNFTLALLSNCGDSDLGQEVSSALCDSVPVFLEMFSEYGDFSLYCDEIEERSPLTTTFMDVHWQNHNPSNPADAAIGPQAYDSHLYYSFGGVAAANEEAYMTDICNRNTVQTDAAVGNSPLFCGEWALPTQFNATDEFLYKWADAQKLSYSKGVGWIFWNFKIEKSELAGNLSRQWSYMDGVDLGYLTKDPSQYNDPNVCDPYITSSN